MNLYVEQEFQSLQWFMEFLGALQDAVRAGEFEQLRPKIGRGLQGEGADIDILSITGRKDLPPLVGFLFRASQSGDYYSLGGDLERGLGVRWKLFVRAWPDAARHAKDS